MENMKVYRFFKRDWVKDFTRNSKGHVACIGNHAYINEWKFEPFFDEVDQYRVRVSYSCWEHFPREKGTCFEWQITYSDEWEFDRVEANQRFKEAKAIKYMTQKIPEELKRYIRPEWGEGRGSSF